MVASKMASPCHQTQDILRINLNLDKQSNCRRCTRVVRLHLLGIPRIERDGIEIGLGLRKAMALIAYLATEGQPQSRDLLASLLWPENDQSSARANLRRTLYRIRKELGKDLLSVSPETLEFTPGEDIWVDVKEFQRSLAEWLPEATAAGVLDDQHQAGLQEAVKLYAGDFMEGFTLPDSAAFDEWQFFTREGLRQKLAKALQQLAHATLRRNRPSDGIPFARRWLALDQLHEPAHRLLMELYARAGQQSAALRQYHQCQRMLEESLGVSPEPQTTELYEMIRARKEFQPEKEGLAPPEVRYARSEDVHIAYQVLGTGPLDVLVVTGFVSHLEEIWKEPGLAATLRQLAQFSRLILFDKRGVGLSDRVGYPPTLENTVDDLRAVMEAAGSEHAVLFGFSEGGPASLLFCATYPESTLGLILYGTMAKGKRSTDYPWALTEQQYTKWLAWLQDTWGKPVPHDNFAPTHLQGDAIWEWFARLLRLGSTPGEVQRVLEVCKDIDVRHVLPAIHVPTLILHRTGDQTIQVQAGRYLAEHIPQARYVELEGCDHWFWLGDTQSILGEMGSFVSGLKPPTKLDRTLATILCMEITQKPDPRGEQPRWSGYAIRQQIERLRGKLWKENPDTYIATFDGPSRALQCGRALSRQARQHSLSTRIALHTGECQIADDELRGAAVEIAETIMRAAEVGEVWLSRTVKDLVVGANFSFEERGGLQIKGGLGTWQLFKLETEEQD
jgi:DNA-binding SARP family transcriptional activator/pimeloyl-ACP methyl ester carboxylesterase